MSFDFRSRLTWIGRTDSGVVRQRLYDRGIHGVGLSLLDPGAKTWAAAVRKEAPAFPFFYYDPHWDGLAADGSALKARQRIDSLLVGVGALPGELLMLDLELVSAEYERRLLFGSSGNRGLFGSNNPNAPTGTQAGRPFGYTNAPFQNHTVVDMQAIYDAGGHWYSQGYYGDMSPADLSADLLEIVRDMEAVVVAPMFVRAGELVHPFYDGLRIANDQRDGCYFTAERIPGVFSALTAAHLSVHVDSFTKDALRTHYRELAQKQAAA
jgi:hypothetical protein